jgi:hypothetical protein
MKNQRYTTVFLAAASAVLAAFSLGCGMLNSLVGGNATVVTDLWGDVPKLEGATRVEAEMPAAVKVAVNAVVGGSFDFVVYTTTKSGDEVKSFYSVERMQGLGWDANSGGCNSISAETGGGTNATGGFCTFTKVQDGKQGVLLIVLGQADDAKQSRLFYARAVLPPTPRP